MWERRIEHSGLNKVRVIRGKDMDLVEQKAKAQLAIWNEQWKKRNLKESKEERKERGAEQAVERTKEAVEAIENIKALLKDSLAPKTPINFEKLKHREPFSKSSPVEPKLKKLVAEPLRSDKQYARPRNLFEFLIPALNRRRLQAIEIEFTKDREKWAEMEPLIKAENFQLLSKHTNELKLWDDEKTEYLTKQKLQHIEIDRIKVGYSFSEAYSIVKYCGYLLERSNYPETFPHEFDLDFVGETGILIVDYSLPTLEDIPTLKELKYIASKNDFIEKNLSKSEREMLYDNAIYQVALRTIHELLDHDQIAALKGIVFNGWVEGIDLATGKERTSCIISLQVRKEEFTEINLSQVDPKACFKSLKGVGSSKLHSMTAIAPVISISRDDKRFVSSYDVADSLDSSSNLAIMDWEDFEHLVRELFEKEFSTNGGEVKVTQASRDGGVDAIAFDPDPIRGGKIVIQAKRYANTVGVSAVRDLYGTVMNEGATKGILVTTSDYGPDAYEFAKGKPLSLLNGSNLLHLLEKHGTRAKIDLNEARKLNAEAGVDHKKTKLHA